MKTRRLGDSDLMITPLGFGAWAIGGGDWAFGWGAQDDADSVAAIHEAIDVGMNWVDTAAVYGLGHSEEVVGKAVAGMADRPYLFTKCERVWDEHRQIGKSLKADSIRRECEASLKRLGVDAIDLYQIHWPEPAEDIEEGWQAVVKLKEQGKIRWGGVSNFDATQLATIAAHGPVTSLQPPYSAVRREVEAEILPYCRQHDIGVIVYSPMQSGLLTGTWTHERKAALPADDWRREKAKYFQEPLFTHAMKVADLFREVGRPHGRTPGEVALAWALRHPAVTGAIVGARKPGQLRELAGAATLELTAAEADRIDAFLRDGPG